MLDLRTRSLELSSRAKLSRPMAACATNCSSARPHWLVAAQLMHDLLPDAGDDGVVDEDDIAALSQRIGELVSAREQDQRDLGN